ncbi:flagellin [Peribacillus asahii]|uniref:flagellin N-terminal helical domain-containing protein n=1 Tax=Peribacillus asahii TaxID=228899 RepID=UPI0020795AC9|nr:flagellin [Peribacillus asahii]USK69973.1 flagellin [Peribacillus asahii]
MIINHNISALNNYRQLGINNNANAKSMEKLSSGLRINRAGDDAAGLAISEKMRAQVRGLDQASRNSQDGISMIQTAEGALQETHNILQRMRELATQAANDTNVEVDRNEIQKEMNQLSSEINRIGNTTEFNTQKILNGGMDTDGGGKITQAEGATVTLSGAITSGAAATTALSGSITVDNRTFDLSSITLASGTTAAKTTEAIDKLKELTYGGVKLGDLVDIKADASNILTFTAKSAGESSSIQISSGTGLGNGAGVSHDVKGTPTTIERAGLQATSGLTSGTTTISKGDTLEFTIGDKAANVDIAPVKITFDTDKSYDTSTEDGRAELIKDLNAALQDAGLDGKVTASLSQYDATVGKTGYAVQFISETGQDIYAAGSALTDLNFGNPTVGNVEQVAGPGAQGTGFSATFQIGANQGQSINLNINDMRASALGITGNAGQKGFTSDNTVTNGTNDVKAEAALDVSTHENASAAIKTINDAIEKVSAERSNLGATQNRLEHTISNLNNASENLTAAESRIRDVDMAKEVMEMTRANILGQASQAMLAQANQKPQSVLQLLG